MMRSLPRTTPRSYALPVARRAPVCQYSTFNAADLVGIKHCRSYNELVLSASWSQSIRPYYHEKLVARDAYQGLHQNLWSAIADLIARAGAQGGRFPQER